MLLTKGTLSSLSIASLFVSSAGALTKVDLSDTGAPILAFTSGSTLSYSSSMAVWVKISESWWKQGSDLEGPYPPQHGNVAETTSLFRTALTLGHLETEIHAAKLFGNSDQWRKVTVMYARRIAAERFIDKAEELIRELVGPLFWYVCISTVCPFTEDAAVGNQTIQILDSHLGRRPYWEFLSVNSCKKRCSPSSVRAAITK